MLCFLSGLGHMYEVSSGSGLGSTHFNRQVQHHEDCTKGPDGKGNTNKIFHFTIIYSISVLSRLLKSNSYIQNSWDVKRKSLKVYELSHILYTYH